MLKAMSERSVCFLEAALSYLYSVCVPHVERFGEALFTTFVTVLTQSLLSVPFCL